MSRFSCAPTSLDGVWKVERKRVGDARGFLVRMFCAAELAEIGWNQPIAQINHTYTAKRGTVRGMHFQRPPNAEMKLVSCLRGEVWDVAVDLRVGSPSYLKWHAERLSADNGIALLIPQGFAHGFQTLSDDVEMLYLHSAAYAPESEGGLNPRDPGLAIDWPLEIAELSARDANHPLVADGFGGVNL